MLKSSQQIFCKNLKILSTSPSPVHAMVCTCGPKTLAIHLCHRKFPNPFCGCSVLKTGGIDSKISPIKTRKPEHLAFQMSHLKGHCHCWVLPQPHPHCSIQAHQSPEDGCFLPPLVPILGTGIPPPPPPTPALLLSQTRILSSV
jgi:hypothetical protein